MRTIRNQLNHLKAFWQIRRHFANPYLILLLRLGWLRFPYFLYRITDGNRRYAMLARPTTTSMADVFVLREVLVEQTYRDVLPLLDQRPIRLVDIGANLGSFSVWMDRVRGLREAYCFEPEPDSFRLLHFNLTGNGCRNARAIHSAVGGETRTVNIALREDSPGGTNIYGGSDQSPAAGSVVPVVAMAEWLGQVDGDFDLLKLDCEGAEWEILRQTDARQLARFRVLVAEIHADPQQQQPVTAFAALAESLGFRTVRWDNRPHGLYLGVRGH